MKAPALTVECQMKECHECESIACDCECHKPHIDDCDQSITEPGLMADESTEHDYHTCECSACRKELWAWCNNVDESGYDN